MPQFQRKLFILFLSLFLLTGVWALAQTGSKETCGNNRLVELQRQLFPGYDREVQEYNTRIRNYLQAAGSSTLRLNGSGTGLPADTVYTIPVVIHVVHPSGEAYGAGTNISYAQIRSQLEALNAAFSMSYPSYNGQWHPGYAKNAKIRFCLARNPSPATDAWATGPGGMEYGVRRYADRSGAYDHKTNMISARQLADITHTARNSYPFDQYLNIWLVRSIDGNNGTMGYAKSPVTGNYPLDGIVMRADVFGDNTGSNRFQLRGNLMQGKILAHEAGHYLNLLHIFQDGCAGTNGQGATIDACDLNGDLICDTRPTTLQNIQCSDSALTTCTTNYDPGTSTHDMINNYMSYADDNCMNTFTSDQVKRMWATLQLYRRNLWQAANLAATGVLGNAGCVPGFLNAAITIDKEQVCAGQPVRFSNPKAGNTAVMRQWKFIGATSTSGDSDTVRVVYDVPGEYTAVITVSDGSTVLTDSLHFTVVSCKLDSSLLFMSHWYFGNYAAIDFSSGTAVRSATAYIKQTMNGESSYPGQLAAVGSGVSLSDSSGNLLFYSNGVSVWNRDHVKISTGPIFGNSDINYSSRLSYIPYPGQPGKYYIAGVYPRLDKKPETIRFVLVDVAANTVTPYQEFRNPLLPPRFSSHMTVVPHCNGTDYWIIVKGQGWDDFDPNFYSFIVTASGIDSTQAPVVSTGFKMMAYAGSALQFMANRNGDKLILTTVETALYDFDSRTGKVSNEKMIPEVNGYINIQSGASFSPNGQYVYIMRRSDPTQPKPYWLFQYRVSDLAYNVIPTLGHYYAYSFQLGPDNQLYILNGENYLARLADPDNWGGAKFNDRYIYFAEPPYPMRGLGGLPSFIDAKRKEPLSPDFSFQSTGCASYSFSALCFESYTATWDFGDGTPLQTGHSVTHTYAKSGEYTVKLTLSSSTRVYGSVTKQIFALPSEINITGPDSACAGSTFNSQYFTPAQAGAQYRWSVNNGIITGADSKPAVNINWSPALLDSGTVSLEVWLGSACILRSSKTVRVKRNAIPSWTLTDSVCITAQSIVLSASPAGGIFIGPGISNNLFSPGIAGLGNHLLIYRYTGSCNSEIQKIIIVHDSCAPMPPVTPPAQPPVRPPGIRPVVPALPVTGGGGAEDSTSIPNIFSPNNDGIHDTWRLAFLNRYPTAVVSIFDRYGALVFHSIGYTKEWDGRYKRKELPLGTYYYIIIPEPGNRPLSGSVTLVR